MNVVVCHKIWQHFITYSPHERLQRHKVIKENKLDQRVSTFLRLSKKSTPENARRFLSDTQTRIESLILDG